MSPILSQLLPIAYGICFLLLLVQAFRVMGNGFRAVSRPTPFSGSTGETSEDRTGKLTIHPELLEADGRLTEEGLLTVRFTGDNENPASAGDTA